MLKKLVLVLMALTYTAIGAASSPLGIRSIQILPLPTGRVTIILTATGGTPDAQGRYTYILGASVQVAAVATYTILPADLNWFVGDSAQGVIGGTVFSQPSTAQSATLTATPADCSTGLSTLNFQLADLTPGISVSYILTDGRDNIVSQGPLPLPYTLNVTIPASAFPGYFLRIYINGGTLPTFSYSFPIVGPLSLSDIRFSPSCTGGNNTISYTVVGGTAPFSACLAPAANPTGCTPAPIVGNTGTFQIAASDTGNYIIRVSDSAGCTSLSPSINVAATPLRATVDGVLQPTCQQQGFISFTISGGIPPYRYCLAPADNPTGCSLIPLFGTSVRTTASAGTYVAYVVDSNGCTANSIPVTLNQPNLTVSLGAVTQPLCNGGSGSASFTVTGGSSYSACIAPTENSATCTLVPITGSSATLPTGAGVDGSLTVRVSDVRGCVGNSAPFTITQPGALSISASITKPVSCNGFNDGQITAIVGGGTAPYRYFLNGTLVLTTPSTTHIFTGLLADVPYTVSVIDANGCGPASQPALTLGQPSLPTVTIDTIFPPGCKAGEGSVVFTVEGGLAPFRACIAAVAAPQDCTPTPIAGNSSTLQAFPGSYVLLVIDSNGCTGNSPAFVIPPFVPTGNPIIDYVRAKYCCPQ